MADRARIRRPVAAAAAAVALAVSVAGCGGGDPETSDAGSGGDASEATSASTGETSATDAPSQDDDTSVSLADFEITAPGSAESGTTFTVTNEGNASHTWTATDGPFDTGTLAGGEQAEVTIEEPGTYEFVCTIHPSQMSGSIEITG